MYSPVLFSLLDDKGDPISFENVCNVCLDSNEVYLDLVIFYEMMGSVALEGLTVDEALSFDYPEYFKKHLLFLKEKLNLHHFRIDLISPAC